MQKFPGYDLLKKKLDPTGKGKTVSEIFQEKLAKYNVNFQNDLKPAVADTAYIAIPDISPLGSELQKNAILTFGEKLHRSLGENQSPEYTLADTAQLPNQPATLNYATSITEKPEKDFMFPALDFIAATEIEDIAKAREIFEKIRTDNQFTITKKTFAGYDYYSAEKSASADANDSYYTHIYSAIIGKNLIVSSKEDSIRFAISSANNLRLLGFLRRSPSSESLADTGEFNTIASQMNNSTAGNRLLSLYLKFNFASFFKKDACNPDVDLNCFLITDYFKYPSDIIIGLNVLTNEDGIGIAMLSNEQNFSGAANIPFSEGLSKRIPQSVDGRYANMFIEHTNINDLYYAFKKNNLTDKGLAKWNELIAQVSEMIGFNPEIDFVDQIDGKSGGIIYTSATAEPEGVMVMHVKDTQKAYAAIEKITELIKQSMLSLYELPQAEFRKSSSPQLRKIATENEQKLAALRATAIVATDTPDGKIYSFKIPNTPISFDFSLENNELILGSHNAAVVKMLAYANSPHEDSLQANQLYLRAKQYGQKDGFTQTFVVPQAIADIISYFAMNAQQLLEQSMGAATDTDRQDCTSGNGAPGKDCIESQVPAGGTTILPSSGMGEGIYALGAILRTIKFFDSSSSIQGSSVKATAFFDIKEIPAEEKARAEKTIANWASSNPNDLNF